MLQNGILKDVIQNLLRTFFTGLVADRAKTIIGVLYIISPTLLYIATQVDSMGTEGTIWINSFLLKTDI